MPRSSALRSAALRAFRESRVIRGTVKRILNSGLDECRDSDVSFGEHMFAQIHKKRRAFSQQCANAVVKAFINDEVFTVRNGSVTTTVSLVRKPRNQTSRIMFETVTGDAKIKNILYADASSNAWDTVLTVPRFGTVYIQLPLTRDNNIDSAGNVKMVSRAPF